MDDIDGNPGPRPIPRRAFLAGAAAAVAVAACGRRGKDKGLGPGAQGLVFNGAQVELAKGDVRLAFALFHGEMPEAYSPDVDGTLTIKAPTGREIGPLRLRTFPIVRSAGGEDATKNPEKPSLVFVAPVTFDVAGYWDVVADVNLRGRRMKIPGRVGVAEKSQTIGVGAKAVSVPTPTVGEHRGVEPICTRVPPCTMHATSLDDALRNGKPTVVSFATPALCTSRMCGPDVDVVERVHLRSGDRANFIHVEIYKDSTGKQVAPAVASWKVDQAGEPWVFFVDPSGTVKERMSGPIGEFEVDEAVGRLTRR